jgi:hypothetical protein
MMAEMYRLHRISSADFHTLLQEPWPGEWFGVALVTYEPWLQKILLAHQHLNRALSPLNLARLADAMRAGEWLVTGQTIIFSTELRLMNGQNRLKSASDTETTIDSVTIWNVPLSARKAIDIGKKWAAADILASEDVPDYGANAAALRTHYRLVESGTLLSSKTLPDNQILDYLAVHPRIRYSVAYGYKARRFVPPSLGTALHYLFTQKDDVLADGMFQQLATGDHQSERDPVWILREMLSQRRQGDGGGKRNHERITYATIGAQCILTWKALRHNRAISPAGLVWRADRDPFPEIA